MTNIFSIIFTLTREYYLSKVMSVIIEECSSGHAQGQTEIKFQRPKPSSLKHLELTLCLKKHSCSN